MKIYSYEKWKKYGIIEYDVDFVNSSNTVAYRDYKTQDGTVIKNGQKFTGFCLTYNEALQKARDLISKEIEAHSRATARLLQIGINLK